MPTAPIPRTWVDREIPPYSTLTTEIYDTISWLLQPPMVKLRLTTTQVVANSTYTAIAYNAEDFDPYNWHNPTNPTRITPTYPGWYRGWIAGGFASGTAGVFRIVVLAKNGTQVRGRRDLKASTTASHLRRPLTPFFIPMNGTTDYLEAFTYHDSGSSMTLPSSGIATPEFFMRWWGPL